MTLSIRTDNGAGETMIAPAPEENLWIDLERPDGSRVYVGSLYFQENPDGSVTVQWGTARGGSWEPAEAVTIPADEVNGQSA